MVRLVLLVLSFSSVARAATLDDVPPSLKQRVDGSALDDRDLAALGKGDVLAALLPGDGVQPGLGLAIVDAPPALVFPVLRDYAHLAEFMPYVHAVTVDSHEGNRWLVSYQIRGPLGIGNRDYQLEALDEKSNIGGLDVLVSRFHFTGRGNITSTDGTWQLVPIRGGTATFLRYEVRTDPGGSFPTWLKHKLACASLAKVVDAVRKRALSTRP